MTEIYCRFDDPISLERLAREEDESLGWHTMLGAISLVVLPLVYLWRKRRP